MSFSLLRISQINGFTNRGSGSSDFEDLETSLRDLETISSRATCPNALSAHEVNGTDGGNGST